MKSLVGYTGFVGSNLAASTNFDGLYNSKNISQAYGTRPELLIYAGVPAAKYLANKAPEQDLAQIHQAEENIQRIEPKKLVLISTIDVFKNPVDIDESTPVEIDGLAAYGLNRYRLEEWVRENYPDALIIRLPGLFGKNLKKNFIYDYIHRVPFMLSGQKFLELVEKDSTLNEYYSLQDNGFYRCKTLTDAQENFLKEIFNKLKFSALNFTDSRNVYQFYPLDRLWADIEIALKNDLKLLLPVTEPVGARELYKYLSGEDFVNEFLSAPLSYNCRTIYAKIFNGNDGYVMNKQDVMNKILKFVESRH